MIVIKFGGASLADLRNFQNVTTFLKTCRTQNNKIVVVVSAMKDVTDNLMRASELSSRRNLDASHEIITQIFERHFEIASMIKAPSQKEELMRYLEINQVELKALLQAIAALQECTPRALDLVLSFGERLSSILL